MEKQNPECNNVYTRNRVKESDFQLKKGVKLINIKANKDRFAKNNS